MGGEVRVRAEEGGSPKIGVEISRAGIYNVVVSARARDVAKDKEGL